MLNIAMTLKFLRFVSQWISEKHLELEKWDYMSATVDGSEIPRPTHRLDV